MPIEHKDIPENGLHEPKGASTANQDDILFSDGAGGTGWRQGVSENGLINTTTLLNTANSGPEQSYWVGFFQRHEQFIPTQNDVWEKLYWGDHFTDINFPFDVTSDGDITPNRTLRYFWGFFFNFCKLSPSMDGPALFSLRVNGIQELPGHPNKVSPVDVVIHNQYEFAPVRLLIPSSNGPSSPISVEIKRNSSMDIGDPSSPITTLNSTDTTSGLVQLGTSPTASFSPFTTTIEVENFI